MIEGETKAEETEIAKNGNREKETLRKEKKRKRT